MLRSAPGIEVVGTARDGAEASSWRGELTPDVVTLDVEMPGMSGLEALPALLAVHRRRVVMVSALTQEGAEVTLAALELGAVDFLPKPGRHQVAELKARRDLLVAKVLRRRAEPRPAPARADRGARRPRERTPASEPAAGRLPGPRRRPPCVVIGISTGGPQALSRILPALRPPIPPIADRPAHAGPVHRRLRRAARPPVRGRGEGGRGGGPRRARPDPDRPRRPAHDRDRAPPAGRASR